MTRITHTYAVLEVPSTVYAAVRALLSRAGYSHAFHDGRDGEVIDMQGIALAKKDGLAVTDITVSTLLSSATKEGRVEFSLNGELTQMDLDKAREIVAMLQQAIEASMTDQMLFRYLTERLEMEPSAASRALLDFRELRQGSRHVVNPN